MVWSHYADEAYAPGDEYSGDYDGDEEEQPIHEKLSFDDWSTWFSRDLLNMWMSLREYTSRNGVSSYLLTDSSYHEFAEFVYYTSHGYPSPHPS